MTPRLCVVVAVVDGRDAVAGCLDALRGQQPAGGTPVPSLEVIVPWDASIPEVGALAGAYPEARFLDLGELDTERPIANAAGQHELIDQRRTAGLDACRGELVAMLEDRGWPAPDWAATVDRLHRELPHAVIGGAVANGADRPLNRAVFLIDFADFEAPFAARESEYVSDVNVAYAARALEATRELWLEGYQETTVHWALAEAGETLWLTPEMLVVEHRRGLTLAGLAAERFHWGRLFATTRLREVGPAARLGYTLLSPLLPPLLLARILRAQAARGRPLGRVVRLLPHLAVLLAAKAVGEMVGYATDRI